MKRRFVYLLAFLVLLLTEILIGAFVRDAFIRPYLGDVLVTVLLCCLVRIFLPEGLLLPAWVFLAAAAIECVQLLGLPARLRLENTVLEIALGSTFDWKDVVCYAAGCIAFAAAERFYIRKERSTCNS